ncbi:hypothetical protein ACFS7Z_16440 [Pontibacter toksunensis]|uniref:SpoIIAA-like protein n=1 Tax=Pontibacter toksunensis TaxID=1332631 RepID=A0ABW6BY07_9BACT
MILHQSSLITLDYNPATDILVVEYPDVHDFLLPHIRQSLAIMVEAIRNYDVKKLLLDASRTIIDVSEEENRQLTLQLAADLMHTRLQKVARIQPLNYVRETRAQENINRIRQEGMLPYQLETFTSKAAAMDWLAS